MGLFSRRPRAAAATSAPAHQPKVQQPTAKSADAHILHAFDDALSGLIAETLTLGTLVSGMVGRCAVVFLERNAAAAKAIIDSDMEVDRHKDALMQSVVRALARHAPVASDLRLILAAEHIAGNLERAADHAKNIAKRALSLPNVALDASLRDLLVRLHRSVAAMLADAMRAFADADPAIAADVLRRDDEPDGLYDDLFHAAIARLQPGASSAVTDVQALFAGKSLERIGDHATNIAEEVRFLARGDFPVSTRT